MPVVTNISLVDKHNKEFVAIGYECMGEFGIEGRRYFRKGGDNRTHQIHIFEQSNHKFTYKLRDFYTDRIKRSRLPQIICHRYRA